MVIIVFQIVNGHINQENEFFIDLARLNKSNRTITHVVLKKELKSVSDKTHSLSYYSFLEEF